MRGDPSPAENVTTHRHPAVQRQDGYAPLRDYGVLGDGRTVVLVASDGQVDWWPIPALDSPPVCAAILDPGVGGYFSLQPCAPYEIERRYVPGTNVLETTYYGQTGSARVTDALNSGIAGRLPWTELARRVQSLEGSLEMRWEFRPGHRFDDIKPVVSMRGGTPVIQLADQMLALVTRGGQVSQVGPDRVAGVIHCQGGERYLVSLTATDDEPLLIEEPDHIDARLDRTVQSWQAWADVLPSDGRWVEPVRRSALVLKTLRFENEGAIAAAATTSLPERIGGDKNYDYRFAWIRDSAFTLDAFMNLGLHEEVQASVSWILSALRKSAPKLHVFYTLGGDKPEREEQLDVPGYRHSQPVRTGNAAANQLQLGVYGDLFDMMGHYVDGGHVLDDRTRDGLARLADQCCDDWRKKDSGIWELPELEHYTISKIGCWVALDRAARLAEQGQLPADHADRWAGESVAVKQWVNANCWSEEKQSYTFYAGTGRLDAAVLLAGRTGFERGQRLAGTIEAVLAELGRGPMVFRYSGMEDEEGCFLACSFWLVSAMAHNGQYERARRLMDDCVALANDLGILAEEIDPQTGDFLGNLPQGLSHLALINAAHALRR